MVFPFCYEIFELEETITILSLQLEDDTPKQLFQVLLRFFFLLVSPLPFFKFFFFGASLLSEKENSFTEVWKNSLTFFCVKKAHSALSKHLRHFLWAFSVFWNKTIWDSSEQTTLFSTSTGIGGCSWGFDDATEIDVEDFAIDGGVLILSFFIIFLWRWAIGFRRWKTAWLTHYWQVRCHLDNRSFQYAKRENQFWGNLKFHRQQ